MRRATADWSSGIIGNSGGMTIAAGATLDLPGSNGAELDNCTLTNKGTINWSGQGQLSGSNGAVLDNDAAFNITGDSASGALTINNSGTIIKTSPVSTGITYFDNANIDDIFNSTGTVDVNSGTLVIDGAGTQVEAGTFDVAAGSALEFDNMSYGCDSGDVQLNAGTTFAGAGLYEFIHGTLSINTNLSVANFTQTGGTINGPDTLAITGAFNWDGGDIDGTGTTTVPKGATLSIQGPNTVNLTGGHVLNIAGSATWSGASAFDGSGGSTVNISGTFAIQSDSTSGGLVVDNSGTITKTSPVKSGWTFFSDVLNNAGTVDVNSGILALDVGGPNPVQIEAGIFNVASGAELDFNSTYYGGDAGDVEINSGTQFTGNGLYEFDHGSLSINTNLAVADFTAAGGTVNGPDTLTITGAFNWIGGDLDGAGTTTVARGATFAFGSSNNLSLTNGHVLNNAGAATWSGSGQLDGDGGSVFNNSGTLAITNDSSCNGLNINNSGTVTKISPTGSGTTDFDYFGGTFDNSGTVDVQSGVLELAGGGAFSSASFNISAGAEVYVGFDNWQYSGTNTLSGTISISGAGIFDLDGGTLSAGAAGATLKIGSSTQFDWSGGYIGAAVGTTLNLDGTLALLGTSSEVLSGGGTVKLAGTFNQTGSGNLTINGTGTTATTLEIASGSSYVFAADSGIAQGSNAGGVVDNSGIVKKTVGVGISTIATPLSNTGTISVNTGTIDLTGTISQVSGTTLEAGTWNVTSTRTVQSTLTFASPPSLSAIGVGASVALTGPNSAFTTLSGVASNAGSLSLANGASLTITSFTNTGTLSLGAGDTLNVSGKYTQTAPATLEVTIDGTPASGEFGQIVATGSASLAGTLNVTVPASFSPTVGSIYAIVSYSSDSGEFGTIKGLTLPGNKQLTPAYHAKNFTLDVGSSTAAPAGLAFVVNAPGSSSSSGKAESTDGAGSAEKPMLSLVTIGPKRHPGHGRAFHALVRGTRPHLSL
jgi:fibronectin-binding autotransporter adhesin